MKKGWEIKKLGDYYEITSSKRVFKSEWKNSGIPFFRAREIVKLAQNGFVNNELFISEDMYQQYSEKYGIPKDGDIMVTGVGTLGICYVVKKEDKFYFKDGNIIWLKKKNDIDSRFVEYAFKSEFLRKQIDNSMGATVGTFTIIKAKNTNIPIPPLPEQKRIVAILDEAFTAIAKARTNAEKNLAGAREVFDSYLNSVFSSKGVGWEDYKFGELIDVLTDYHANGSYQSLKANVELKEIEDYAWMVRSTDFENNFENDKRFITEEAYNFLGKSKVFGNEIIISKIGNVGKVYLMPKIERPCSLAMNLFLIRVNKKKCQSEFVYRYLNSKNGRRQIESRVLGTTTKTITKDNVRNIPVPVPQLNIQNQIILKLNELSAQTKRLEEIYKQKIANFDELKKSILHKAFEGEL